MVITGVQGRLESLLNFQTMVADLTGMEMSNASLLDEATAAAEAMTMASAIARGKKPRFLVASNCHPQTIAVCQSRADGLGITVEVMPVEDFQFAKDVCGALVQARPCPLISPLKNIYAWRGIKHITRPISGACKLSPS